MRALVPAAASALRACRLGGLWGAAGSCGALRLLPARTLGSCGSGGASRLLPKVTLGLGRIKGEWFSREVNDLFWTLEASACFGRFFL